jgi:hypothetical protein
MPGFEVDRPPRKSLGFPEVQVFSTLTSDETRWIIPETSWLEMATLRCRHFYFLILISGYRFEIPRPPRQSQGFAEVHDFGTLTGDETGWIIPVRPHG